MIEYIDNPQLPEVFVIRDGKIVSAEVPRHRGDLSLDALLGRLEPNEDQPDPAGTAAWDRAWMGGRHA